MRRFWHWYRARRPRTQVGLAVGALLAALFVVGSLPAEERPAAKAPAAAHAEPSQAPRHNAAAALAALTVKGRAPKTGYARSRFGDGWATVDGCDVRDRVLRRDLTNATSMPGSSCAVRSGRLADPYVAQPIVFV